MASALKLAPQTIGAVLEEKLSEDELKQVVAMLESPVNRKYTALLGDMQRALGEKLIAETRTAVDPKVRALYPGYEFGGIALTALHEAPRPHSMDELMRIEA